MRSREHVPFNSVLRSLIVLGPAGDAELLRRFTADRDEIAFQAIVRRHGGLVLDVCQAVLRNRADAEDAYQATFLTLATRAGAIRTPASLGAWLHGTAYRIALKAKTASARRRRHETHMTPSAELAPIDPSWAEVRQAIHEEVQRLPHAERAAIVLCYLLGRTQDESARCLGLTKDGIKKRLERGRATLRIALRRRGLGPAAVLASTTMPLAAVPRGMAAKTADTALGSIQGSFTGVEHRVVQLIEKGPSMFAATKLLVTSSVFAAAAILAISVTWSEPSAIATAAPRLPERKDDPATARTELDGAWKVVAVSDRGKNVKADKFKGLKFTFRKGKLIVDEVPQDKEATWNPGYLQGSAIKIDRDRTPKEIDLKLDPKVAKDTTIRGIYQIRKGHLLIAVRTLTTVNTFRPRGYATVSGTLIAYTLELVEKKVGKK